MVFWNSELNSDDYINFWKKWKLIYCVLKITECR